MYIFKQGRKPCLCILIWSQSILIKVFVTSQMWLWVTNEHTAHISKFQDIYHVSPFSLKISRYTFLSTSPSLIWNLVTICFNWFGNDCNAFFLWNSSSVLCNYKTIKLCVTIKLYPTLQLPECDYIMTAISFWVNYPFNQLLALLC